MVISEASRITCSLRDFNLFRRSLYSHLVIPDGFTVITVHADVVGSLLRPPELLRARKEFEAGALSPERFREIENRAVDRCVELQEGAGLPVVTDGEMRRESFQSQMTAAVRGFGKFNLDAFLWGEWRDSGGTYATPRPPGLGVVRKLERERYLTVDEFLYLKSKTDRVPKVTLPSAGLWVNFWSPETSRSAYGSLENFLADVVAILREEVEELARQGARYIQLDAPHYGLLVDPSTRKFYEDQGWSLERWLAQGIELDNAVISGFPDVTFGFHL